MPNQPPGGNGASFALSINLLYDNSQSAILRRIILCNVAVNKVIGILSPKASDTVNRCHIAQLEFSKSNRGGRRGRGAPQLLAAQPRNHPKARAPSPKLVEADCSVHAVVGAMRPAYC